MILEPGPVEEGADAPIGASRLGGAIAFPWQDSLETDCVKYADDDYCNHPTVKAIHERIKKDGWTMVQCT
jgi:hypothetical protein